jgi:glycosyltransferase involved in cell wall biosynthesis
MRPLSFLHLTTFYPPYSFGGDAMYLYRLCHGLAEQGHHVEVIHCVDSFHLLHPGEPKIAFAEHPGVIRHELRSPYGWLSPLVTQQTGQPWLKLKTIQKVLASRRFDVIQFHNTSLLGLGALKIDPGHPDYVKMYMTHEHWLICPMHVLWKYNARACDKPDCLRCVVQGKRPPALWRYTGMLPRTVKHVDQFVSPSRFTARMHADRGFPMPVAHLPYFIDPVDEDWIHPQPPPQEKPYILFVGRLELIKGLQTVIPLWDKVPDLDLLVVGGGNYSDELRTLAGSNPRIRFLGPMSQKQLGALYYHATAVVVPSITYETFGIIIIEAFARKTPVIVRNLGALPEVVEDSGGGFSYHTDEQLLDAIHKLSGSPGLRRQFGENGYRAFRRMWDREAHMKLYFDFLRNAALRKLGCVPWESPTTAQ